MRFEGKLKSWNDERGFGFIESTQVARKFCSRQAFKFRAGRPQVNQVFSFEVELGPQGKKRAKNVEIVRAASVRSGTRVNHRRSGNRHAVRAAHFPDRVRHRQRTLATASLVCGCLPRDQHVHVPSLCSRQVCGAAENPAYARKHAPFSRSCWRLAGALLAQQPCATSLPKLSSVACSGNGHSQYHGFVALCSPVGRSLWVQL